MNELSLIICCFHFWQFFFLYRPIEFFADFFSFVTLQNFGQFFSTNDTHVLSVASPTVGAICWFTNGIDLFLLESVGQKLWMFWWVLGNNHLSFLPSFRMGYEFCAQNLFSYSILFLQWNRCFALNWNSKSSKTCFWSGPQYTLSQIRVCLKIHFVRLEWLCKISLRSCALKLFWSHKKCAHETWQQKFFSSSVVLSAGIQFRDHLTQSLAYPILTLQEGNFSPGLFSFILFGSITILNKKKNSLTRNSRRAKLIPYSGLNVSKSAESK